MADYGPMKLQAKSGSEVIVRAAELTDAPAILALSQSVIGEAIYSLTSAEEFRMTMDGEEKWIESHKANPNHVLLVAEMESRIVGLLDFSNGRRSRGEIRLKPVGSSCSMVVRLCIRIRFLGTFMIPRATLLKSLALTDRH